MANFTSGVITTLTVTVGDYLCNAVDFVGEGSTWQVITNVVTAADLVNGFTTYTCTVASGTVVLNSNSTAKSAQYGGVSGPEYWVKGR